MNLYYSSDLTLLILFIHSTFLFFVFHYSIYKIMAESISVFGVKISDTRGKKRECDICGNSFTLLIKEHQCKRCKRAVCYNCS